MTEKEQPLIKLENVTKVFLTDEVETHALPGVSREIHRGEYVSVEGLRAAASRRCLR